MGRAIVWLVVGLAAFGLVVLAMVPGALDDLPAVSQLALFAAIAGIPGMALVVALALRRGRAPDDLEDPR